MGCGRYRVLGFGEEGKAAGKRASGPPVARPLELFKLKLAETGAVADYIAESAPQAQDIA